MQTILATSFCSSNQKPIWAGSTKFRMKLERILHLGIALFQIGEEGADEARPVDQLPYNILREVQP